MACVSKPFSKRGRFESSTRHPPSFRVRALPDGPLAPGVGNHRTGARDHGVTPRWGRVIPGPARTPAGEKTAAAPIDAGTRRHGGATCRDRQAYVGKLDAPSARHRLLPPAPPSRDPARGATAAL